LHPATRQRPVNRRPRMEERVRMMRGVLRIQSAPQEGVKLFIELPGLIKEPEEQTETGHDRQKTDNHH